MKYDLLINGSSILAGNIAGVFFIAIIVLAVLYFIFDRIRAKLRENETMKYEFVTIMAHKFRTPLSASKWLLENMTSEATDARTLENIKEITKVNEKLISLTGTLIELTNLDNDTTKSYAFEKTNLCEFVTIVANAHRALFMQKNISMSSQCISDNIVVSIDRTRLEFVLQTLFENACNYTPPGRQVEIKVGRNGNRAVITVVDHGIGIDRADLDKIFTKFFRTKNAQLVDTEGFGIGLYLARSIIKRLRGRMIVYSAGLNQGSTFTVELPVAKSH